MDLRNIFIACLAGCLVFVIGCASKLNRINSDDALSMATSDSIEMQFGIARMAERNDRIDQAYTSFQKIIQADPNHVEALHRLGVISSRNGDFEQAGKYFDRAVAVGNPSADLLGDIGYAQYLSNDFEQAVNTFRLALRQSPHNQRLSNNLALVLGKQKQYDNALQQFRQSSSEAESIAGLAFVQSQTGLVEEAKASYPRALEFDSSLDIAANGLVELNRAVSKHLPASKTAKTARHRSASAAEAELVATVVDVPRKSTRFNGQPIKPNVVLPTAQQAPRELTVETFAPKKIDFVNHGTETTLGSTGKKQTIEVQDAERVVVDKKEVAPANPATKKFRLAPIASHPSTTKHNRAVAFLDSEDGSLVSANIVKPDSAEPESMKLDASGLANNVLRRNGAVNRPRSLPGFLLKADQTGASPGRAPMMQARELNLEVAQPNQEHESVPRHPQASLGQSSVQQVAYEEDVKGQPNLGTYSKEQMVEHLPSNQLPRTQQSLDRQPNQAQQVAPKAGRNIWQPNKVFVRILAPANGLTREEVGYQIEVTNNTLESATNVRVQLKIPADISLTTVDREAIPNDTKTIYQWKIPVLKPGQTERINYKAIALSAGEHKQEAELFIKGKECDAKRVRLSFRDREAKAK